MTSALSGGDVCAHALAFYLHEVESRGLHQEAGFASTVNFAVRKLDMPEGTARELVSTGRRLAELPELTAAFAAGEIVWSKVRRSRSSPCARPRRPGSSAPAGRRATS